MAHVKFTVLLMPNGSDKITGHPLQEVNSSKVVEDPDIKAWLALGTKAKKKGGGKKKKGMLLDEPRASSLRMAYCVVHRGVVSLGCCVKHAGKKGDGQEEGADTVMEGAEA